MHSLEAFCKKVVLRKIHWKTFVSESLLVMLQASGLELYLKRDSNTGVFLWVLEIFRNSFFTEHLQVTASVCAQGQMCKLIIVIYENHS